MGTQKNKSVSNRSREAASNPDTITWYLGRPLTYLDLDHTGIRHDTHAGILHEHGLVDFHRHVGDGIALPMLDGRPVAPGPAQEEAREAVFNMVPTGRHWETEDGMDDPYVWTRSGAKVMLTIKRHSKVLKSEFTGLEAFMIKEYKNLEEEENSNHRDPTVVVVGPKKCRLKIKLSAKQPEADDETASILSDDGTAIITALDEGADILGSSKKRKTKYTRPDKAVPRAELGRDGRLKSTQHRRRPKMPKTKIAPARMISSSKTMQPSPLDRRREVQQKGVRKTSEIVVVGSDNEGVTTGRHSNQ